MIGNGGNTLRTDLSGFKRLANCHIVHEEPACRQGLEFCPYDRSSDHHFSKIELLSIRPGRDKSHPNIYSQHFVTPPIFFQPQGLEGYGKGIIESMLIADTKIIAVE